MKLTPKVIFFMVLDVLVILIGFAVPWYRFSVPMINFEASTSLFMIPFQISNLIGFFENDVFQTLSIDMSAVIAGTNVLRFLSVIPYVIIIFIVIAFVLLLAKKDKKNFYLFSLIAMGSVLFISAVGLLVNNSIQQGIREILNGLDSFGLGSAASGVFYVGFSIGFYLLIILALILLIVPPLFKHLGDALPASLAAIGADNEIENDSVESPEPGQISASSDHFSSAESQGNYKTSQNEKPFLTARQLDASSEDDQPEIASLSGDDGISFSIRRLPFTIGRDIDQVDGLLSQSFVSRLHCRFEQQNERITLMDLNSTHGTFINHEQLPPNEQFFVLSGDVITVGKINMTLSINPPTDSSSTSDDVPTVKDNDQSVNDEDDDEVTRFQLTEESTDDAEDDDDELTTVQVMDEQPYSEEPKVTDEDELTTVQVIDSEPLSEEQGSTDEDELTTAQVIDEAPISGEDPDAIVEDEMSTQKGKNDEPLSKEPDDIDKASVTPSSGETEDTSSDDVDQVYGESEGETFKINFADRRCLICITPDVEEEVCVITACPFRIGRNGDEVDYVIASSSVSRSHLMITKDEQTYYVTDLHASNRVKINGEPITQGIEVPIEIDDVITIGNREYRFEKV